MTFEDVKRVMAGESPKEVMNDMSRESLDPAVADVVARKSVEAIIKDIEDAAVEFHAGVDKRPRVRMTESQLTKFADDGEFLPTETDDIVLESGAIGRRLERRLNPATRRSAPKLSSGRSQERAAQLDSSVQRAQNDYDDAVKRVENLEEGLRILEDTGEWKGGDLGVVASISNNWTVDGPDEPGLTPKNLTVDEVAERGGAEKIIDILKEKIRISKIEARHQEDIANRKKIRREQGVLDVEDIPDDVMSELREEAGRISKLSEDSDEYKQIFGGAESDDRFVYHAGASELDDGVLDPRRSVGSMQGGSQGPGDTRGLNNRQVEIARETIAERQPGLDALKSLSKWKKENPEGGRFRASSPEEAKQLELFGLIGSAFKVDGGDGLDYDIPQSAYGDYGYREIDNTIQGEEKFLSKYKAVLDMAESVDGQFLSSYPAGKEIVSGGYFGRFAPKTVPDDIASVASEFERQIQQVSSQIKDRDAYDRWMTSRRGTAWLVDGKEGKDITNLLGPGEETQILGRRKPIFGISQKVTPGQRYTDNGMVTDDILKEVGPALMARAIKLQRQGESVSPESILSSSLFDSPSGRLSSGARNKPSKTQRVAGIAGSRATGRVLDAVLKRSGADEDTRERVKYGVNMAGALAAGGPVGFATALAVDVARRAGREVAERGLEEAVQRGKITQNQMDVAMQAVDRVAPNGLPDPVVDKLSDAWSVASDFIDERVVTDENRQRLDEFGNVMRSEAGELAANAGEVVGAAREKIGKKFKKLKKKKNNEDDNAVNEPDLGDLRARFGSEPMPSSTEYDDPFAGFDENNYKPAKTEFDDFDGVFSSGRRAGRSSDVFRDEYNSRIGISKSTPNSAKPVSGYVVHRSHNEEKKRRVAASGKGNIGSDAIFEIGDNDVVGDGLTALGEIEVILKPEVSNRTAYGRGEALQSAHRPVAMNSNDPDDIADAIMNADGISSSKQNTEAMLHLLGAKMDKNFSSVNASMDENGKMAPVGAVDSSARSHEPFEAQILGGFKKNEVEGIHYPYTKVSKVAESEDISDVVNEKSLASKLEKLGFTPEEVAYFYSISGGKPLNTASMVKLKEYRAAKKIKEKYEGMGVGYVKFAHPQGINIENPRSYDKTASPTARVDEILKRNIDAEVEAELKKTLDGIRKSDELDLMVD
jgi:hypothetical protein